MVYVDSLSQCRRNPHWKWSQSCHLIADTIEELHEFAERLGLRRAWFMACPDFPHYDLTTAKRRQAVAIGAVEISSQKAVEMRRLNRLFLSGSSETSSNPQGTKDITLQTERRGRVWWVVGLPDTDPDVGPYKTEDEAEETRRRLQEFFRYENLPDFVTCGKHVKVKS